LLIVATVAFPVLQDTELVRSCVLVSLKVPVAVNCCVVPRGIDADGGFTLMDTTTAGVTVRSVLPLTEPAVAVIVVEPCAVAVARPCAPCTLLIEATLAAEELHVADVVRSCMLPSV
jgi:hypothetical protein